MSSRDFLREAYRSEDRRADFMRQMNRDIDYEAARRSRQQNNYYLPKAGPTINWPRLDDQEYQRNCQILLNSLRKLWQRKPKIFANNGLKFLKRKYLAWLLISVFGLSLIKRLIN